jgi:hypothetical protein
MRQRVYSFLVVLVLIFCRAGLLIAQHTTVHLKTNGEIIKRINSQEVQILIPHHPILYRSYNMFNDLIPDRMDSKSGWLSSGFYSHSLGFICKKELQLDKYMPLQFRFRLGSLEYTNWMEGKPNALPLSR